VEIAQLWMRCRVDPAARCALIERYAPLAAGVARRMRLPAMAVAGREDLESAGIVGLIDAVDRFDPGRGVPFEGYATARIRGAILDELRRVDERTRDDRVRLRRAAHSGESPNGYLATTVSLESLLEVGYDWGAEDGTAARDADEDLKERVEGAISQLPARQRELLARYYREDLTLREAGVRMGISEARASQLHVRALEALRRLLLGNRRRPQPALA
jgi:RNA polymerase sigma factor FliA